MKMNLASPHSKPKYCCREETLSKYGVKVQQHFHFFSALFLQDPVFNPGSYFSQRKSKLCTSLELTSCLTRNISFSVNFFRILILQAALEFVHGLEKWAKGLGTSAHLCLLEDSWFKS